MDADHVHVMPVQLGEARRRDHLVGWPGGGVPVRHVHDAVHDAEQGVHVVRRQQHRDLLLAGQLAEHRDDLLFTAQVKVGERLVEQEQLRPGDQRVRDQHALLLAAGQLTDPRVGVTLRPYGSQRLLYEFAALPGREAEPELVPVQAERHHVAGAQRHVGVDNQLLRHVADRGLVLVVQRDAVHQNPPARRLKQAEDDAKQGGLAGPVRADDPGELASPERERDVAEHLTAAEAHADTVKRQQGHGHGCSVEVCAVTASCRACTSVRIQVW